MITIDQTWSNMIMIMIIRPPCWWSCLGWNALEFSSYQQWLSISCSITCLNLTDPACSFAYFHLFRTLCFTWSPVQPCDLIHRCGLWQSDVDELRLAKHSPSWQKREQDLFKSFKLICLIIILDFLCNPFGFVLAWVVYLSTTKKNSSYSFLYFAAEFVAGRSIGF